MGKSDRKIACDKLELPLEPVTEKRLIHNKVYHPPLIRVMNFLNFSIMG